MVALVSSREFLVRPMSAIRGAPALANAMAMAAPMPEPHPVTRMVLSLAESSGRLGSIAAYEDECQVFVKDGNGAEDIFKL
jgi:hypothetical protein